MYDGNLAAERQARMRKELMNAPRHAVARELLEAVDDDRADLRRVLALLVGEAGPHVKGLP
jgi:hypothetical protein